MQPHSPVLRGGQIDWFGIVIELTHARLDEFDGMRVGGLDGARHDLRFRKQRELVVNTILITVGGNFCGDRLPYAAERDLLDLGRQMREQDAKRGGRRDGVNEDERATSCVREIQPSALFCYLADCILW